MSENNTDTQCNPTIDTLLPSDLLSEEERVIFALKPSLWAIAYCSFRTVLVSLSVILLTLLAAPYLSLGSMAGYVISFCGIVIVARVGFAFLQWLSRSYVLTDKRVIRIRGVFTIDIFQCSLLKLQNTFLQLTLPQRIFGIGSIALTTAGTGGIEAIWRHVKNPLEIHHQLLQAMNRALETSPPAL